MLFNSLEFLVFFPLAVLGFYIVPKRVRYIWLLLCSYYFYMSWNPEYALLILLSTVLTYAGSIVLEKVSDTKSEKRTRIAVLSAVILINLGILFFFKYYGFFGGIATVIFGKIGIKLSIPEIDVLLPVGISFYTFQALGYSIDVYRGDVKAEKNFLKYALFVSFFPQLVAGPIERSKNLLKQVNKVEDVKFDKKRVYHGLLVMLWGLFLKMVIADRVAILVNTVFDSYYLFGGVELIYAAIGFAIQIYCDFASYSTIAIGAAEIMGFTLMENFDSPYLAVSVKDFWRRWHISLSTWFRDYLYIPLGGNRCSKIRKYFNLMVTFLASGLWHGAALTYVVWGGLHGFYQIVGELTAPICKKIPVNRELRSYKFFKAAGTFILVDFAWIFFRAESLRLAIDYIKRIFVDFDPWSLFSGGLYTMGIDRIDMNVLIIALIILAVSDVLKYVKKISVADYLITKGAFVQVAAIVFVLMYIVIFGAYGPAFDSQAFIYFQF